MGTAININALNKTFRGGRKSPHHGFIWAERPVAPVWYDPVAPGTPGRSRQIR